MNFKILKQVDQFAQPPKFLVARGGDERDKKFWNFFGSWLGFFLTIMMVTSCLFYLSFLVNEMFSYNNDVYKS